MEKESKDRAAVHVPPPLIFLACLVAGLFLDDRVPLPASLCPGTFCTVLGRLLILASLSIAVGAFAALIRHKTPFNPAKPTVRIVRAGAYRFSRNPMYLALLLLLGGIALLRASPWLGLAVVLLFVLLRHFAVEPEEKYLAEKFGDDYLAYKGSVRRWI